MIKMRNLSIEALEGYICSLFIAKDISDKILTKISLLNNTINSDEFIEVQTSTHGNNIRIILKVINDKLPKCFIVNHEYKFNSYIAEIFDYPFKREKQNVKQI